MRRAERDRTPGLDAARAGGATLLAAVGLVLVELAWLVSASRELTFFNWLRFLLSQLGHSASMLSLVAGVLGAASAASQRLSLRASHLAAGLCLLVSPYLVGLARFTFSGPQVRDLSYQPVFVGFSLAAFSIAVWGIFWLFFLRLTKEGSASLGVFLSLAGAVALWLNASFLRNEYEPLHTFLVLFALVLLWWGGLELVRRIALSFSSRPAPVFWEAFPLGGALVFWGALCFSVAGAAFCLSQSQSIHWLVFGESTAARYLAVDPLGFFLPSDSAEDRASAASLGDDSRTKEKPSVVDPRVEAGSRSLRREAKAPHLVVFSIDNLQSDRVGANGYKGRPSTPNIDRLAKRGANFRRAYTHYPGTRVFLSSMLVGRRLPPFKSHRMPQRFVDTALTRLLKQRDYHVLVKGVFELTAAREFAPKNYAIDTYLRRASAREIRASGTIPHIPLQERFAQIETHLGQAKKKNRPVFVWLHMLQPHRFRGKFVGSKKFDWGSDLDALYDASVADTDALIPRMERLMEDYFEGSRDVLWVIMSDHGAGLTRGKKKEVGKTLYEDQVHVPLIFAGPGISPSTHEILVDSSLDVSATLLDWVGIEPPSDYDGVSLVPVLEGTQKPGAFDDRLIALRSGSWTGAVYRDHKLIRRKRSVSLYRLTDDPLERENRVDVDKKTLRAMKSRAGAELVRSKRLYTEGIKTRR